MSHHITPRAFCRFAGQSSEWSTQRHVIRTKLPGGHCGELDDTSVTMFEDLVIRYWRQDSATAVHYWSETSSGTCLFLPELCSSARWLHTVLERQWMCGTSPAPRGDASSSASVLSHRNSACTVKPKSSISAAGPRVPHVPNTAA